MVKTNAQHKTLRPAAVLAVIFLLLSLCFLLITVVYPDKINSLLMNRKYKVYGGMTDELKDCELFEDMRSGKSFCFIGDSITYGSWTNGIPWYQPLIPYIKGDVTNLSYGGWTVLDILYASDDIPSSDVYVIAIGINDVLFPDDEYSASSSDEFTYRCGILSDMITGVSPNSKIYFIAPWTFLGFDSSIVSRGDQFRTALSDWCENNDCIYINPDPVIRAVLDKEDADKFMYNDFHPNAPEGVGLFSYAVLLEDHNRG